MNVIIDYNVGNLHNLKNALDYSGIESELVSHADDVKKADRILLLSLIHISEPTRPY